MKRTAKRREKLVIRSPMVIKRRNSKTKYIKTNKSHITKVRIIKKEASICRNCSEPTRFECMTRNANNTDQNEWEAITHNNNCWKKILYAIIYVVWMRLILTVRSGFKQMIRAECFELFCTFVRAQNHCRPSTGVRWIKTKGKLIKLKEKKIVLIRSDLLILFVFFLHISAFNPRRVAFFLIQQQWSTLTTSLPSCSIIIQSFVLTVSVQAKHFAQSYAQCTFCQ